MKSGDEIELFNGRGAKARAFLVDVRKKGVTAELASLVEQEPSRATETVLAVAAPKADRFRWLVEKATELGIDRLIPLECERSIVHPGGAKLDKLRAVVVAACKQSGRNRLLTIDEPKSFAEVAALEPARKIIADVPTGVEAAQLPSAPSEGMTLALIGPEGGWTESERAVAKESGFARLAIGRHIMRIETATIAVAAVFASEAPR